MAYDAELSPTVTLAPTTAELARLTPAKARALYELAVATRLPVVWEIAAHALAGSLAKVQAALKAAEAISPPQDLAKPARRSARAKAAPAVDLTSPLANPPASRTAVGAFHCVWTDGSETRVSAVTFHSAKPLTRWAAAFQAADRLRRSRGRDAYAASFGPAVELSGRYERRSDLRMETAAWRELIAVRPLPALLAIYDEITGEVFDAPAGSAFGAGDPGRASALEAQVAEPVMPHRLTGAEAFGEAHHPGGRGDCYYLIRDDDLSGHHWATGWPAHHRAAMIADAREAFTPAPEVLKLATAQPGEGVGPISLTDLDGADVVISPPLFAPVVAAAVVELASAKAAGGRAAIQTAGQTLERLKTAATLLALHAGEGAPIRYRLTRSAGGLAFRLTASDGRTVLFGRHCLPALAFAEPDKGCQTHDRAKRPAGPCRMQLGAVQSNTSRENMECA